MYSVSLPLLVSAEAPWNLFALVLPERRRLVLRLPSPLALPSVPEKPTVFELFDPKRSNNEDSPDVCFQLQPLTHSPVCVCACVSTLSPVLAEIQRSFRHPDIGGECFSAISSSTVRPGEAADWFL